MQEKELPEWAGEDIDPNKPSIARIYDYLLGGYHNFEVDRERARLAMQAYPDVALSAKVNRAFLRRAVRFMLEQGITQFIDIGSGIPTVSHVHEIAQRHDPESRVVYVDIDPVAIAHSVEIIRDDPYTLAFEEDARNPEAVFSRIEESGVLDLGKPVGILLIALLHFIPDSVEARGLISRYTDHLADNSYLAFTHGTYENTPPGAAEGMMRIAVRDTQYRREAEIRHMFDKLDFVEPGIVFTPLWRPEGPDDYMLDEPGRSLTYAGVAHLKSFVT